MNDSQKKLKKISKGKTSSWSKDAKFRLKNKIWLNYSSNIARRILAALEDPEKRITQKKLATTIRVSPQYICKVVKGRENLSLETIAKISNALNVELITFPSYKYSPITKSDFSTVLVGVQAFAFSMNSDYNNNLSINSGIVEISQNAIHNIILPLINTNNNEITENIDYKILNNENYSVIKQTGQNG